MQTTDETRFSTDDGRGAAARAPSPEPQSPSGSANPVSRWSRLTSTLKDNPWLSVTLRALVVSAFMLGFAGIGLAANLLQPPGVHVASEAAPSSHGQWLAPTASATPPARADNREESEPAPTAVAPASSPSTSRTGSCGSGQTDCDDPKQKQGSEGLTSDGKVILNTASAEVLTRLPGIGARRAEAIVQLRERLGGFRRVSDLLRVRGIGVKSLKRMLPHLVLDPPAGDTPETPKPKTPV